MPTPVPAMLSSDGLEDEAEDEDNIVYKPRELDPAFLKTGVSCNAALLVRRLIYSSPFSSRHHLSPLPTRPLPKLPYRLFFVFAFHERIYECVHRS